MTWRDDAACKGNDRPFFTETAVGIAKAKAICAECSVRNECLIAAIDNREEHGVWGGLTPRERLSLSPRRRGRPVGPAPKCGTLAAVGAHYRRDEKPCETCRVFWNQYSNERDRARRGAA